LLDVQGGGKRQVRLDNRPKSQTKTMVLHGDVRPRRRWRREPVGQQASRQREDPKDPGLDPDPIRHHGRRRARLLRRLGRRRALRGSDPGGKLAAMALDPFLADVITFNAILRESEASSHYPRSSFLARTAADPLRGGSNEEFRTQRQQHPGDACPSLSAAVVAAVTRSPWNRSPTCDAFRRIWRSDASSSALSGFGLKLEGHI
jgi:hypothetical protein